MGGRAGRAGRTADGVEAWGGLREMDQTRKPFRSPSSPHGAPTGGSQTERGSSSSSSLETKRRKGPLMRAQA